LSLRSKYRPTIPVAMEAESNAEPETNSKAARNRIISALDAFLYASRTEEEDKIFQKNLAFGLIGDMLPDSKAIS